MATLPSPTAGTTATSATTRDQVIIHPQANGELVIIFPSDELPIAEVAKKDVPAGQPYFIVARSDLPDEDFAYAASWEIDFTTPHGKGLGHDAWAAQYVDPMASHEEAHAENAARDLQMLHTQIIAEQENRQFDALQAMKAAGK
jgi:hypothetical protein